ncbi:hypothetical protein C2G38_2040144 [Gigaspora rosea]|uniref:Uncharacterized protein n=1 Tax=Gigaspora rosea TaxID=44941 RepID=A0A397V5A6_9GLOM|nr:hypothetical protein C2G38_2040144 [Gigaspora rosea]
MNSEEKDKERRIIVSDDRRCHMNDGEIYELPESSRRVQNIECANKQRSGSRTKIYEDSYSRKDGKRMRATETIDSEMDNQLFNPGGSTFLKTKETMLETKINSY